MLLLACGIFSRASDACPEPLPSDRLTIEDVGALEVYGQYAHASLLMLLVLTLSPAQVLV